MIPYNKEYYQQSFDNWTYLFNVNFLKCSFSTLLFYYITYNIKAYSLRCAQKHS